MQKSMDNLYENEKIVKDFINVLCLFVLQVAKKDNTYHPLTKFDLWKKKINCFSWQFIWLFPILFFSMFLFLIFYWPILLQLSYKILEHFILLLLFFSILISNYIYVQILCWFLFHSYFYPFILDVFNFFWLDVIFKFVKFAFFNFFVFMATFKHWFEL